MKVSLLLLFLIAEPFYGTMAVATLTSQTLEVPAYETVVDNLNNCAASNPSLMASLPALTQAVASESESLGQLLQLLGDDPEAHDKLFKSDAMKLLLGSPQTKDICQSLADPLHEHMQNNEHAKLVPTALDHIGQKLFANNDKLAEQVMMQLQTSSSSDLATHLLYGYTSEMAWSLRRDTTLVNDFTNFNDTTTFYRYMWMGKAQNLETYKGDAFTCNTLCNSPASGGEPTYAANLAAVVTAFRGISLVDDPTLVVADNSHSCYSTFSKMACCRQPRLAQNCGKCYECATGNVPPTTCDQVRELMSDCLVERYSANCNDTLGVHMDTSGSFKNCEDDDKTITCSGDRTIKINSFAYGRSSTTDMADCHNEMSMDTTTCSASGALALVTALCDGATTCTITDSLFGDPCPGFSKYMEGTYTCKVTRNTIGDTMDDETGDLATVFDTDATECLCQGCGWEQASRLCQSTEGSSCPFCSGLDTAFWSARTCPVSPEMIIADDPNNRPHVEYRVWAGVSVLMVALAAWQLQIGPFKPKGKGFNHDVNKVMFDSLFGDNKEITPEMLVDKCDMDLHFARGIVRKAAGGPASSITSEKLFAYLDKSGDGWLSQEELVNLLYRNYPEKTAQNLAGRFVKRANGENVPSAITVVDRARVQGQAQIIGSHVPAKSSPYFNKLLPFNPNHERVPSFRHLSQLEAVPSYGRPIKPIKSNKVDEDVESAVEVASDDVSSEDAQGSLLPGVDEMVA